MALTFSDAKKIPIAGYLSSIGIEPAKIRGNNYWYRSPLRVERDPSFKVNVKLNLWYDHGSGEGGTIIDLGAKLNTCSAAEFVQKLSNDNLDHRFSFHQPDSKATENKLTIISVSDLRSQELINYLRGRAIDEDVAFRYCKEVSFQIADKVYSAVGFGNRSGGYELRNHWFKGSSTPKDVSFIDNDSPKLCVAEGFMDFLSIEQLKSNTPSFGSETNFLILNSLSFLSRTLPLLKSHETFLFLDNDQAGIKAKKDLHKRHIPFVDCSGFYSSCKDVNEYLVNQKQGVAHPTAKRSIRI
ncbi:MAG TPA: toprim domain-containing protein [Cyclobacteriaceae bacterium]|nr:toprim domain-containing protein [Cyclobacteriaceae bacterium]